MIYPFLIGAGASLGLIALYLGIMTLTADWYYAEVQFEEYRWWIIALSLGLGIQSTLFTLLRRGLKGAEKKTARSTLAASGGISTGSMVVCCLHHLTDVVPFLGFPILAVTLQRYQTYFFLMGVLSNFFGTFMMLRMMDKHGMIRMEINFNFLIHPFRTLIRKGGLKMHRHFVVSTIIIIALFGVWSGFHSNAIAFDVQTNDESAVRLDVKPFALVAGKPAVFEIRLNTHSVNLSYDMVEVCSLQDSEGRIYKAVEWKGSPLGGHHRRGTLEFPKLEGAPQSVKLVIRGVAGVPERSFEWKIGS